MGTGPEELDGQVRALHELLDTGAKAGLNGTVWIELFGGHEIHAGCVLADEFCPRDWVDNGLLPFVRGRDDLFVDELGAELIRLDAGFDGAAFAP